MSLKELIVSSYTLIEEAEVPEDLRPMAFAKVLDLLAQAPEFSVPSSNGSPRQSPVPVSGGGSRVDRIAAALKLDPEIVRDVYDAEDERLNIIVPRSRFNKANARATKDITLLMVAGRHAAKYDDDWTPARVIRDMCEEYGVLDSSNFAKTIMDMPGVLNVKGKGQDREVKLNRAGIDEAAALIVSLMGGERS